MTRQQFKKKKKTYLKHDVDTYSHRLRLSNRASHRRRRKISGISSSSFLPVARSHESWIVRTFLIPHHILQIDLSVSVVLASIWIIEEEGPILALLSFCLIRYRGSYRSTKFCWEISWIHRWFFDLKIIAIELILCCFFLICSDYLFKLLLIGDSGVGKSCLLLRFAVSISLSLFLYTHYSVILLWLNFLFCTGWFLPG